MNKRQLRKKYRKAAKIGRNLFYAYALARKLNQQCAGCSADYHHFRKTNLKRCLTYHKWCLKHNKKLTDLYYGIQNRNKRRYSEWSNNRISTRTAKQSNNRNNARTAKQPNNRNTARTTKQPNNRVTTRRNLHLE
mgnify:CR=1 FL=1